MKVKITKPVTETFKQIYDHFSTRQSLKPYLLFLRSNWTSPPPPPPPSRLHYHADTARQHKIIQNKFKSLGFRMTQILNHVHVHVYTWVQTYQHLESNFVCAFYCDPGICSVLMTRLWLIDHKWWIKGKHENWRSKWKQLWPEKWAAMIGHLSCSASWLVNSEFGKIPQLLSKNALNIMQPIFSAWSTHSLSPSLSSGLVQNDWLHCCYIFFFKGYWLHTKTSQSAVWTVLVL